MPRAIVKNGVLLPVDPLPTAWKDGTEVRLVKVNKKVKKPGRNGSGKHPTDVWMDEVEKAAGEIDAEGDRQFAQAIEEIRKEARNLARQGKN